LVVAQRADGEFPEFARVAVRELLGTVRGGHLVRLQRLSAVGVRYGNHDVPMLGPSNRKVLSRGRQRLLKHWCRVHG